MCILVVWVEKKKKEKKKKKNPDLPTIFFSKHVTVNRTFLLALLNIQSVSFSLCYSIYYMIRAVRPSTCNVVRNLFGHLIRASHYFQTLGWIRFIYGLMIGMGPKFFSVPSPPMT